MQNSLGSLDALSSELFSNLDLLIDFLSHLSCVYPLSLTQGTQAQGWDHLGWQGTGAHPLTHCRLFGNTNQPTGQGKNMQDPCTETGGEIYFYFEIHIYVVLQISISGFVFRFKPRVWPKADFLCMYNMYVCLHSAPGKHREKPRGRNAKNAKNSLPQLGLCLFLLFMTCKTPVHTTFLLCPLRFQSLVKTTVDAMCTLQARFKY